MAPSIYEQISITKQWWKSINLNQDPSLHISEVKKFFVKKGLTQDLPSAEKEIQNALGNISTLEYDDFYKVFGRGIFRVALLDMLTNIEQLSKNYEGLPLSLKLGAYRRNLLLSGLLKGESEL